jgi:hypothetical protein
MMAHEEFWNWFAKHEPELFNFESNQETIFDAIATQLEQVDPDLTFEIGPKNGVREFIVSAGGIRRAFPAVTSLVAAAPALSRWKVVAFRPRRSPNIIELGDKSVNPTSVQFTLLDNGEISGIYLFIPGFDENDTDFKQIGYLLLDEALGEFDVETRLGLVKMLPPENQTNGQRYPLIELPEKFDALMSRLGRQSGQVPRA